MNIAVNPDLVGITTLAQMDKIIDDRGQLGIRRRHRAQRHPRVLAAAVARDWRLVHRGDDGHAIRDLFTF